MNCEAPQKYGAESTIMVRYKDKLIKHSIEIEILQIWNFIVFWIDILVHIQVTPPFHLRSGPGSKYQN